MAEPEGEVSKEETQQPVVEKTELEISLNAITGTRTSNTKRFLGSVCGEQVVVLMDSRSKHNFINPWIAKKTKLNVEKSRLISVMIANIYHSS